MEGTTQTDAKRGILEVTFLMSAWITVAVLLTPTVFPAQAGTYLNQE